MRHILMTADAVGGVWTYAVDLARGLGDRGIAVTLAVMGPEPTLAQCAEARALPLVTMHHAPFRLEWMNDPWHDVRRAGGWLLDLERDVQPDVVHLNGYCHAALPWQAPVLIAAHSCVLSWWADVHGEDAPVEWDRYAANVSEGLFEADLVVAPTAAMLAALNFHYGPLRKAIVIPNGRSIVTRDSGLGTRQNIEPTNPGSRIPDPDEQPFMFSSGRAWDPAKGIQLLSDVAVHLRWPIYVAGDTTGPSGASIALPNVTCLGRLAPDEMQAWMRRASIYVLPARYEPFGLSILEAAQAGCALVLGDIRSLREVWGAAAVYVPAGNRRALISSLSACIEDAAYRDGMAARARIRARELTADRMADGYCSAYAQLAAAATAPV
jgi:glycosyltransferase involved in cell wall biosynthesis